MLEHSSTLRWLVALTIRLVQVTPFRSSQAILFTLIAQTALMLGMLLPIKVVMLLGVDRMPSYMPDFLQQWSLESLILSLSGLAVVFFVIYLVGEKLATNLVNSAARDIVQQAGKVVLFENQEQVANNTYKKVVTSLAGIIFTCLVLIFLGFAYPIVAIAIIVAITLVAPAIPGLRAQAQKLQQPQLLMQSLQNINNIGFLLLFALIVCDHLYFIAPSIILTIATIILTRQATGKLVSSIADLANTASNREKVSALFFHNQVLLNHIPVPSEGIWSLLELTTRNVWIEESLNNSDWPGANYSISDIRWLQTGTPNIFAFWVTSESRDDSCIVKIFDKTRESQSIHEATLLACPTASNLPAPELLNTSIQHGFHVHVLGVPAGFIPLEERTKFLELSQIFHQHLAIIQPDNSITAPYLRSHPLLWQKLNEELLRPLLLACSDQNREDVVYLLENLSSLRQQLSSLPTALQNPTINPHTLLISEDETPISWHWGQWSLDVLGCSFPANMKGMTKIQQALEQRELADNTLNATESVNIELASFTNALFFCMKSQRFNDALDLIPKINKRIKPIVS
ncbi:hypothetical protein QWI17_05765 [Gilvimarinus sp. SDUM040013]|uniref:ABC transmembrane type-1 domain-containing protein n=1 Tax=Gilvimarinus gilvus TaxID=3058038 RepID=A0ABU4S187_9GAMM|nr:hypothetical protein [Gilvimarinus sp. SDUM040013]MDO3385345.1 hypothetical protein [Gilvimarinus sp. SDUM040013]MDX6850920.1 hypothetical protein [Gilvimarinus sp. SDUM040013]